MRQICGIEVFGGVIVAGAGAGASRSGRDQPHSHLHAGARSKRESTEAFFVRDSRPSQEAYLSHVLTEGSN